MTSLFIDPGYCGRAHIALRVPTSCDALHPLALAIIENRLTIDDIGGNANFKDDQGRTLLAWAVGYGRSEAVRLLLEANADANSRFPDETPPLLYATHNADFDTMRYLIRSKADVHARLSNSGHVCTDQELSSGKTALMMAVSKNDDVRMAQLLLTSGAKVEDVDDQGWSALTHAVRRGFTACMQLLIDNGANPNRCTAYGNPIVDFATDPMTLEKLTDLGATPSFTHLHFMTPGTGILHRIRNLRSDKK